MLLETLNIPVADFEAGTGWAIDPAGACKGDLCIPLRDAVAGDTIDIAAAAEAMSMPLVEDAAHGIWALGPATPGSHALLTAQAPALRLPTLDGNFLDLSSLRGERVLLYAWAPY